MRAETIVPLTEQPAETCASGDDGMQRRGDQARGGNDESHRTSSVADECRAEFRQNGDSYFGSNFSATPFMQ